MNHLPKPYFFFLLVCLSLTACTSDELAFDIIESPVLAVFEDSPNTTAEMLAVTATFYDLDKSGILDQNIGIDSLPIQDLEISVYVDGSALISSYTTDVEGIVEFEAAFQELGTSRRLEWVGSYEGVPFRIYQNY